MTGENPLAGGPETPAPPEPAPAVRERLELQRMELALIRAALEHPHAVAVEDLRKLQYALRLAHLSEFQPGAAAAGGRIAGRADVSVATELEELRQRVLQMLRGPLRDERDTRGRLLRAQHALAALSEPVDEARRRVRERHAGELDLRDLDGELASKALVNVAGGGGGAGYVYIGAYLRLQEAGIVPDFVVGSSIGSVMGLFRARAVDPVWDDYVGLARTLSARELFAAPTLQRRYGLPGLLRLQLRPAFGPLLSTRAGEPLKIRDLEIPYEAVVAGVRKRSYERLPARFRDPRRAAAGVGEPRLWSRARMGAALASRMWQVAAFFDPRVVKAVALGSDELTAGLGAVDAAGFSAAIPGVLHYDIPDPDPVTAEILGALFEREELAALVDGGVTANVPAELAWRRVQTGRLGTRNAFVLAFDCFHPQWDPRHLWLQPITQAVALQLARDARYADWIVRFEPTLSPLSLVPAPETIDLAIEWGRASVEPQIPLLERALEPVWWDDPPPSRRRRFWRRRA
jgi:predicted acylesterase/phospholipase RssA